MPARNYSFISRFDKCDKVTEPCIKTKTIRLEQWGRAVSFGLYDVFTTSYIEEVLKPQIYKEFNRKICEQKWNKVFIHTTSPEIYGHTVKIYSWKRWMVWLNIYRKIIKKPIYIPKKRKEYHTIKVIIRIGGYNSKEL